MNASIHMVRNSAALAVSVIGVVAAAAFAVIGCGGDGTGPRRRPKPPARPPLRVPSR